MKQNGSSKEKNVPIKVHIYLKTVFVLSANYLLQCIDSFTYPFSEAKEGSHEGEGHRHQEPEGKQGH